MNYWTRNKGIGQELDQWSNKSMNWNPVWKLYNKKIEVNCFFIFWFLEKLFFGKRAFLNLAYFKIFIKFKFSFLNFLELREQSEELKAQLLTQSVQSGQMLLQSNGGLSLAAELNGMDSQEVGFGFALSHTDADEFTNSASTASEASLALLPTSLATLPQPLQCTRTADECAAFLEKEKQEVFLSFALFCCRYAIFFYVWWVL